MNNKFSINISQSIEDEGDYIVRFRMDDQPGQQIARVRLSALPFINELFTDELMKTIARAIAQQIITHEISGDGYDQVTNQAKNRAREATRKILKNIGIKPAICGQENKNEQTEANPKKNGLIIAGCSCKTIW